MVDKFRFKCIDQYIVVICHYPLLFAQCAIYLAQTQLYL